MMRQVPLICSGHTRAVVQLRFSGITDQGYFLISACTDGLPMLRDGRTGDWIGTFQGHKGAVWGTSITPDAQRAATASADFTARIWDSVTGDEIVQFPHRTVVREAVLTSDAQLLLTGAQDKRVRLWDSRAPREPVTTLNAFASAIRTCAFLPSNSQQAVIASGNELSLVDVRNCEETAQSSLATQSAGCSTQTKSKGVIAAITFENAVNDFELKNDKLIVASGSGVELLHADTSSSASPIGFAFTRSLRFGAGSVVNSAAICGHCDKLDFAAACEDNNVFRYDADCSTFQVCKGHSGKAHCVRYSPDGHLFASAADDGTIRLWQHTVGEEYGLWKAERSDD